MDKNKEHEYIVRDVVNYEPDDPHGVMDRGEITVLSEKDVIDLNYARALNSNPCRFVRYDPL
jgi:hypothetical protein